MSLDFSLYYDVCGRDDLKHVVFNRNITHNLGKMADACGLYKVLWRPEENGYHLASQASDAIFEGLCKLVEHPNDYEKYNSPNGWGVYEHFVPFVKACLDACSEYPDAKIKSDR